MKNPLSRLFSRDGPERYNAIMPSDLGEWFTSRSTLHGGPRRVATYWRHYEQNPIVRAAVTEVVHALTGIPFIAERYSEPDQTWIPLSVNDPISRLLRNPSPTFPPAVFWNRAYHDAAVTGDTYLRKVPTQRGKVGAFRRLNARNSRPVGSKTDDLDGFVFNPDHELGDPSTMIPDTGTQRYRPDEVIHIPIDVDPDYPLKGLSPIASALNEIGLDYAITEFTQAVIDNGGAVDKAFVTKGRVSESEARRWERRWFQRSRNRKAGGIVVIDGTEGELQNIGMSMSSREMGLMDLRKLVEARVLMAMDVPPIVVGSVVGLENATYSNYMQARLAFHEENTDPNLWLFCSALQFGIEQAFPSNDMLRIRPDLSRVMALIEFVDKQRRLSLAEYREGLTTQTEARAETNRPPLPNGDFYTLPLNVQRVTPDLAQPAADVQSQEGAVAQQQQDDAVAANRAVKLRKALRSGGNAVVTQLGEYAQSIGADDPSAVALEAYELINAGPRYENATDKAFRLLRAAKRIAAE